MKPPDAPQLKISAILFDKDGTLLDYHLSWQPINARAALWAAAGDPIREALHPTPRFARPSPSTGCDSA